MYVNKSSKYDSIDNYKSLKTCNQSLPQRLQISRVSIHHHYNKMSEYSQTLLRHARAASQNVNGGQQPRHNLRIPA